MVDWHIATRLNAVSIDAGNVGSIGQTAQLVIFAVIAEVLRIDRQGHGGVYRCESPILISDLYHSLALGGGNHGIICAGGQSLLLAVLALQRDDEIVGLNGRAIHACRPVHFKFICGVIAQNRLVAGSIPLPCRRQGAKIHNGQICGGTTVDIDMDRDDLRRNLCAVIQNTADLQIEVIVACAVTAKATPLATAAGGLGDGIL